MLLLINQMSSGMFRSIAAIGRNMIVANTGGSFALLLLFALSGFILSRGIKVLQFDKVISILHKLNISVTFLFVE